MINPILIPILGKTILFEGIDGSGKSTQVELFKRFIEQFTCNYMYHQEPTSHSKYTRLINKIRSGEKTVSPLREAYLFTLDRREGNKLIIEAKKNNTIIIQDRGFISTAAYQGAKGADINKIIKTNLKIVGMYDYLIYLNIPIENALDRINARVKEKGIKKDTFEQTEFLKKVSENYNYIMTNFTLAKKTFIIGGLDHQNCIFKEIIRSIFEV